MGILVAFVPNRTMKKWKEYKARRVHGTRTLITRFLEAYMSPLGGCLDAAMNLIAKCDGCGNLCDLTYIKDERTGYESAHSACCRSSFHYEGNQFWSEVANKHLHMGKEEQQEPVEALRDRIAMKVLDWAVSQPGFGGMEQRAGLPYLFADLMLASRSKKHEATGG